MEDVASWPFEKRLEDVFWRSLPKVGPDAAEQLKAVISPQSLAIMASVIVAWIVSHAFGVGAIIDVILVASGVLCMGMAVFSGVDALYGFATRTYNARTTADLDAAADHLARAIAIIGITAVLAVLFRGSPARATFSAGPKVGALPHSGGWRYRPTTTIDPALPASVGARTRPWGDIIISGQLPAREQALALAHEQGHQLLKAKLYLLRTFRIENQLKSYFHSSLWRYLEEALVETQAQLRAGSFLESFGGVVFPVMGGYVYLLRGGASAKYLGEASASVMKGYGLLPEAAALLTHGLIAGVQFDLWFSQQPPAAQVPPPAMTEPRPSAGRRW